MTLLSDGDELRRLDGGPALVVRDFLGEGGQGSVNVAIDTTGTKWAVKWYRADTATSAQRRILTDLVERGAPSPEFLWPASIVESSRYTSFGYVMPLRPPEFVGMSDLMNGRCDVDLSIVCSVGFGVAHSFLMLHALGLCYRDVSFGNVFFNPDTGQVLVCDNDNVGIDGVSSSNVLGTRRFMAPEIVRREALPSTATDLHSVAVLIFYLLMLGHPLVGKRELEFGVWNDRAESELFGADPVFVFDPKDDRNRPSPSHHRSMVASWEVFPESTKDLFTKAFTTGLGDAAGGRVREGVWQAELIKIRDLLGPCGSCGRQNFFDGDPGRRCWSCNAVLGRSLCLVRGSSNVHLHPGRSLFDHHLNSNYDFMTRFAVVEEYPTDPSVIGLRNLSDTSWQVIRGEGSRLEVAPGRLARLYDGLQLRIGGVAAHVQLR